jgi:hypothetical protein
MKPWAVGLILLAAFQPAAIPAVIAITVVVTVIALPITLLACRYLDCQGPSQPEQPAKPDSDSQ